MPNPAARPAENTSPAIFSDLRRLFAQREFSPGEILRRKGEHYRDMYLITDGEVAVELEPDDSAVEPIIVGRGYPIGEIGFLRGTPANASVTARTPVHVLVLDDASLERIEHEVPELAVALMQQLARTADARTSHNLTLAAEHGLDDKPHEIEVLLCRNAAMLVQAQQLRYEVYCLELGRNSPAAMHRKGIIADDLDAFGHSFIAVHDGEVVGTLRANIAREGPLGMLETLYGMNGSAHHPDHTGICTKFIVKRTYRGSPAALQLVSHMAQYGLRHGIRECYIDCIPSLLDYYCAMGFRIAGEEFFHRENGPSFPLKLDLTSHGEKLTGPAGIRHMMKLYLKARKSQTGEIADSRGG